MNFGVVVLGAVGLALGLLVLQVVTKLAADWKASLRRRHNRRVSPTSATCARILNAGDEDRGRRSRADRR